VRFNYKIIPVKDVTFDPSATPPGFDIERLGRA
jgi:hypothetical protein